MSHVVRHQPKINPRSENEAKADPEEEVLTREAEARREREAAREAAPSHDTRGPDREAPGDQDQLGNRTE